VHAIQLALGAFMSSRTVECSTKSWEDHERNQQFGEKESIGIGKLQRLQKEGNARIKKVFAMRSGLPKIPKKAHISSKFESLETDLQIELNKCCSAIADPWSLKQIHQLSIIQCTNCGTA